MYLAGLGIGSYGRIRLFGDQILQGILHLALRHTADLHSLGADNSGSQALQIREYLLLEHRDQLRRRPR